ncbi:hypothetical protein HAX54_052384 [Datura stramonium]|uniref:Uncharacterized protein n=1 Tax=Datura stramonium TaxID=4076 RepID=A0ABS8WS76_DATST|nr:hypothetical protein [Datura stramonium]
MAQKVNKGKGLSSSSHGSKRARRTSEEENEDVRMAPQYLRRYGLRWVIEQEENEITRVDLEIEYSDDNEEDSEFGEVALSPIDDEE